MNLIAICIAFIVSIISVGTPLIFQVISKFDDKYHSEKIIDLFKKESGFKYLEKLLIISPITILLYIIDSNLLVYNNNIVARILLVPVSIVLLLVTILLLIQFIFFSLKVLKYSIPSSFIRNIIKQLKPSFIRDGINQLLPKNKLVNWLIPARKTENSKYLFVTTNFFLYSIKSELIDIYTLLPDYMFHVFTNYSQIYKRVSKDNFPDDYYEITKLIAEELINQHSIRFKRLDYYATGFYWLVGSIGSLKISKKTYNCLWYNLRMLIENGKDDITIQYWEQAFEFIQYNLREPDRIYKSPLSSIKLNQSEIDEVKSKRDEFIEFHYFLGGLLLYKNRIECIGRIWKYTNSEPPKYPLLPSTLGDIFKRYFDFCNSFDHELMEKTIRFNFPKVSIIDSDWTVPRSIKKYLVLLFLRQYSLQQYYINDKPLALPNLPDSQVEKKFWFDNIESFKENLEEFLGDKKLLTKLGIKFISKKWCNTQGKQYPLDLLDSLRSQLKEAIKVGNDQLTISTEKEKAFLESTTNIIDSTLKKYDYLIKDYLIKDSYRPFHIPGVELIDEKRVFADELGYSHTNFDSFLAERLSEIFQIKISESFSSVVTRKFLFNYEDVFSAIDRLEISKKASEFIIFSFKNNLEYYISVLNIKDLSKDSFKGIKIKDEWICNEDLVGKTYFILNMADLPMLVYNEPINKMKISYKIEDNILPKYKIKASLIDLQSELYTRKILENKNKRKDLANKVLAAIELDAEILWKKDAKVIAFRVASAYEDLGLPNKLEEVKPFDEI